MVFASCSLGNDLSSGTVGFVFSVRNAGKMKHYDQVEPSLGARC